MEHLRKRADFLAAAAGERVGRRAFTLQARARGDDDAPRTGFTVTKKVGSAVERNRIRRRLRAAMRQTAPLDARPGFDYVLVARREALSEPFARLAGDLSGALRRIHSGAPARHRPSDEKTTP